MTSALVGVSWLSRVTDRFYDLVLDMWLAYHRLY